MTQEARKYTLQPEELSILQQLVQGLCKPHPKKDDDNAAKLRDLFQAYSQSNDGNRQAMGTWVCQFLAMLIPCLKQQTQQHKFPSFNLQVLMANLPYDEESDLYKTVVADIAGDKTAPLTPKHYLHLVQMVLLLNELDSKKTSLYLQELLPLLSSKGEYNFYRALVLMLSSRAEELAGHYKEEQEKWLELITLVWHHLELRQIIYFLAQWIISLHWIRPLSVRKNLLQALLAEADAEDVQNRSILLYELFSFPAKAHETEDKLAYVNKLKSLPPSLFTVSQLQNIYYYSGSIKTPTQSGFIESVADFQQSNYYIHKYWNRISRINTFLRKNLPGADYMEIVQNIEHKAMELVNAINIQTNAYVETLQSSYDRINDLYHQVEELSLRDTLTGLHNRRFLYNNINEMLMLAVRQQFPISFVIIDIDNFKHINDTLGHIAGDFVLEETSDLLRTYFRKSDFIVRYGGEEFLIVLFNSDQLQTETALETLRQNILSHAFKYQDRELHISVSTGIASCAFASPYSEVNLEYIISEADAAMYESKLHGKNKVTSRIFTF